VGKVRIVGIMAVNIVNKTMKKMHPALLITLAKIKITGFKKIFFLIKI
jgi:hypothetical protein